MRKLAGFALTLALCHGSFAAEYVIDGTDAGMHASVQFRADHVGISPLWGRFNDIRGNFTYDADNIEDAKIEVVVDTASLDSNHEQRDEHLTSSDYLNAEKYTEARFVSTSIEQTGEDKFKITGDLSFMGETQEVTFDARRTGEGETVFGDYRVGFEGKAEIDAADYGLQLMPSSSKVQLIVAIEGVRQ